jgi:hypothetical protein
VIPASTVRRERASSSHLDDGAVFLLEEIPYPGDA